MVARVDDFPRTLRHLQTSQGGDVKPGCLARIVTRAQVAAEHPAVKVDQHVMIFASAVG